MFRVNRTLVRSPSSGEAHPFHTIEADAWVNVVPITRDGQLVMVRQYRHGSREVTLEIPGGIVDPGEDPADGRRARAARRDRLPRRRACAPLGSLNPNPALFGNRVHTFLAEDVERVGEVMNGPLEETVVELVPAAEVPERVRRGEIDHALVVAALHWWSLAREQRAGEALARRASAMKPRMALGDFLVAYLKRAGVKHVFGLPGDLVLGLFHRFGRERGLEIVTFSHEPTVGFAADGYARSTRRLGVAVVTYGAGGNNIVNAVARRLRRAGAACWSSPAGRARPSSASPASTIR